LDPKELYVKYRVSRSYFGIGRVLEAGTEGSAPKSLSLLGCACRRPRKILEIKVFKRKILSSKGLYLRTNGDEGTTTAWNSRINLPSSVMGQMGKRSQWEKRLGTSLQQQFTAIRPISRGSVSVAPSWAPVQFPGCLRYGLSHSLIRISWLRQFAYD
jgi:hypothetical protein